MSEEVLKRPTEGQPFWIGEKRVEPRLNQITIDGEIAHVEHLAMRVLTCLAAHPNQSVSREAILESVWADSAPNDEGLTQAICKLRKILGDSPGQASVIQTIRKVGYRLVAPVSFEAPTGEASPPRDPALLAGGAVREVRIRIHMHQLMLAAAVALVAVVIVAHLV